MKIADWIMLGGGIAIAGLLLSSKCSGKQRAIIAGIYGMPVNAVGVRKPVGAGVSGGIEIFDKRNGKGMIHVVSGDCQKAVTQASTAVAQAAGNAAFPDEGYEGTLYVVA